MDNEACLCPRTKKSFSIRNCSVHPDKLEFVGEMGNDLSVSFADSSPGRGAKKVTITGGSLASPFKGRCPEGAERFVPLPDKSPFIEED